MSGSSARLHSIPRPARITLLAAIATLAIFATASPAAAIAGGGELLSRAGPDEFVSVVRLDTAARHLEVLRADLEEKIDDPDHRGFLLFGPTGVLEGRYPDELTAAMEVDFYVLARKVSRAGYGIDLSGPAAAGRSGGPITGCESAEAPAGHAPAAGEGRGDYTLLRWRRGPFAPGELELKVRAPASLRGGPASSRDYRFRVARTYRSSFRLAALGSDLQQQKFTLSGGVLRKEFTSHPVNTAAAFVWHLDDRGLPRERLPESWSHRINPMIGLPFDRPFERWYLGLNIMIARGFDLNAGVQLESITELAEQSPLEPLAGGGVAVRTEDRWHSAPFVGVSVDAERVYEKVRSWFGDSSD